MKVFGVGFQRTGTSSLAAALNMLGIKTLQFPKELYYNIDHDIIREYNGFTDDPIPLLYKELDKRHPNSKFIHTIRDEKSWLKSIKWLFTTGKVKFKKSFYRYGDEFNTQYFGTTDFDEELFLETYRRYNQDVSDYLANRPDDYLVLDLTQGEGFEKLCPFLDKPMPDVPFPHRNKQEGILRVYGRRFYRAACMKARALLD
ncbi:hypothetical protein GWO43_30935 [candidate division KSB1 bacterium]|nr:hypothetical protein [candidate division KSB1 bacterium]NIV70973.1 hypothetical protein [Phycisphaerae bacterium]NIR73103.1 hypothetical protein [candidate division KSB1 bacterium]NIT75197.1 hypothetical protein [candidate division KSB1 bacterium]NIU29036.1 hypothetical protein [candidate division KSB1 bacterium]